MDKGQAAKWIARRAGEDIPPEDRPRFIELAETELSNLHEGNTARYRLRPAGFNVWKEGWQ